MKCRVCLTIGGSQLYCFNDRCRRYRSWIRDVTKADRYGWRSVRYTTNDLVMRLHSKSWHGLLKMVAKRRRADKAAAVAQKLES